MPKVTIKSLQEQLATVRELREGEARAVNSLRQEVMILKAENEGLKVDKAWLKSMHSNLLQATSEMFRNR